MSYLQRCKAWHGDLSVETKSKRRSIAHYHERAENVEGDRAFDHQIVCPLVPFRYLG